MSSLEGETPAFQLRRLLTPAQQKRRERKNAKARQKEKRGRELCETTGVPLAKVKRLRLEVPVPNLEGVNRVYEGGPVFPLLDKWGIQRGIKLGEEVEANYQSIRRYEVLERTSD